MGTEEGKFFIAFGAVALFLAVVIVFFFMNLYRQQRKYRDLQEAKMNAEITASEQERNKIATELHNDIGPYLSSVKMRLGLVEQSDPKVINECIQALDNCIVQVRGMSKELAPLTVFDLPFQKALKHYIKELHLKEVLKIDFRDESGVVLVSEKNNQVYRILQEIIHNTVKHAQATHLQIELTKEDNQLLIRTADNGIGYNIDVVRASDKLGLGLLSIDSRVDYLNGTITRPDTKVKGTKYNIRIPL